MSAINAGLPTQRGSMASSGACGGVQPSGRLILLNGFFSSTARRGGKGDGDIARAREGADPGVLADLAASWMDAYGIDELRQRYASQLRITDPMRFVLVLDRLVVHDLAWVLSAVLQLCDHEREQPLHGPCDSERCDGQIRRQHRVRLLAASVGVRNRRDAMALGAVGFGESPRCRTRLRPSASASM